MTKTKETKFRAWDKALKEYTYNLVYCIDDFTPNSDRFILEQFIVHEDNQDIYEGDKIQEIQHGKVLRTFTADDIRTFTREYDEAEHSVEWKVIGTIHENEEL